MTPSMIALRPAGRADEPFLRALFVDAHPEFAAIRLPQQQLAELVELQRTAQRAQYLAAHPAARDDVIEVGEVTVGRCWTSTSARELRLLDLAVHSTRRRTGLGRAVLDTLCRRATAAGLPLRLHVWAANEPARRLYLAAGFRGVSGSAAHDGYLAMEWTGILAPAGRAS